MDEQQTVKAPETVRLRHPHTGDIQEVEATPERLGCATLEWRSDQFPFFAPLF